MERYILLCLDCHKIFPGKENHTCKRNLKIHFAAKVDGVNEPVSTLDRTRIRYSESSSFEDGRLDQSLIENRIQIISTTEEKISDQIRKEKTPIFETSMQQSALLGFSSGSDHVRQRSGSLREGLPLFEPELQNSNLSETPIFQDDSYNLCTAPIVSYLCTSYDYPTGDNLSSPSNVGASAGPSDGWNLIDQCEPMSVQANHRVEDGPLVCPICGQSNSERKDFDAHFLTHIDEKPYACDFCDKKFAAQGNLTKHRRTHTGEKPFVCDICDKKFGTHGSMSRHRRTHTGEKPYSCDICDKKFGARESMSRHRRTHTGEKRYSCDVCDRKCNTKWDLDKHRKNHTGETSCPICGKTFTNSCNCKIHIKKVHQKK